MHNRSEFVIAAVTEAQLTIRALDVKLAALLIAALAPIPILAPIAECFSSFYLHWENWFVGGVIVVVCSSWGLAILCYALAIGALSSPSQHVALAGGVSGALYSPGIYKLSFIDALINRSNVLSEVNVLTHLTNMPSTQIAIDREMAYEHLKLIYIRDIKLLRLRWGFRLSGLALAIAAVVYVVARYHVDQCGP